MKSKNSIKNKDFRQFRTRIFTRTLFMLIGAAVFIFSLYNFVLHGKFANFLVEFFMITFNIDFNTALRLYTNTFRNNAEIIYLLAIFLVFFIIFRIYLNRFTKYFIELNDGMDSLINENEDEISLSPELLPLERQMNTIKHALEKQKLDMQVSEQRKNDLIMYLAHDLKTPLASVMGYLNLLHDEGQISEELREKYLSISLDKAQRLEDLINEFFEIARFNLSNITLQYSVISLNILLEQLVYEFKPMLKEKNLECILDIPENITLRCDADKLQRVFDNLLRNAVIYSYDNTAVRITVKTDNNSLMISFMNRGDTIPKENLERIFEQFYRLDTARSTHSGGAGLGLAITKQIIELHKGTIFAHSEDNIIEFIITVPVS